MIRNLFIILTAIAFLGFNTSAQDALKYQLPPAEIIKIVDSPQTPSVSVSGHSYGAFMTANLLANTRLFAAGIAERFWCNSTACPPSK